jgi:hypothetical protein
MGTNKLKYGREKILKTAPVMTAKAGQIFFVPARQVAGQIVLARQAQ